MNSYKEAKINVQKLIKNKKGDFYREKLRENVAKAQGTMESP